MEMTGLSYNTLYKDFDHSFNEINPRFRATLCSQIYITIDLT